MKQRLQMTGALFIAYNALRMKIYISATPKIILTPNTKYDIR